MIKLRHRKTGRIETFEAAWRFKNYESLSEFYAEWEDYYEELGKYYWVRSGLGDICETEYTDTDSDRFRKSIGNHFETRAEAEKAVEKLKAWKRLKEKGFRFEYVGPYECLCGNGFNVTIHAAMPPELYHDRGVKQDLDLLFGGKDE